MANTTNLNLVKLSGSEKMKTYPTNQAGNMDTIDSAFGAGFGLSGNPSVNTSINNLADGLAIVANGNTHAAITSGQYVYVRNHGSLSEGLYVATSNISANGTLSGSNLTADSAGGLNALNSNITSMGKIKYFQTTATTSVTLNLPSSSTHFIIIGTNNRTIYAVLMVTVVANDVVQTTEISKGDNVTVDSSVVGKMTVTFDAARQSGIYDMAIRGENATM